MVDLAESWKKLQGMKDAAAAYNPDALFELGRLYEEPSPEYSDWIEKDLVEALWHYRASVWAAHRLGKRYRASAYKAGVMLYSGASGERDTQLGYHYLSYAAGAGHVNAAYLLGIYHVGEYIETDLMDSGCGYQRLPVVGLHYLEIAAQHDHLNAMIYCANCYYKGIGSPIDRERAKGWAVKGANKGNAYCMNLLGVLYQDEAMWDLAGTWFSRAAELGNKTAANNLRRYRRSFGRWTRAD